MVATIKENTIRSTTLSGWSRNVQVAQITIGLMVGAASKTQLPLVPVLLHQ